MLLWSDDFTGRFETGLRLPPMWCYRFRAVTSVTVGPAWFAMMCAPGAGVCRRWGHGSKPCCVLRCWVPNPVGHCAVSSGAC